MTEPMPPHSDPALRRELLLRDLAYWSDSFWKNEELGERRVQFLITLVTAAMAGLAALYGYGMESTDLGDEQAALLVVRVAIPAVLGLLAIGTVTFFRMVHRDKVTDLYKDRADQVRRLVVGDLTHFWMNEPKCLPRIEQGLLPIGDDDPRRKWMNGGLAITVAALNTVLVTVLAGLVVWRIVGSPDGWIPAWLSGIAAGYYTLVRQVEYANDRHRAALREHNKAESIRRERQNAIRSVSAFRSE